jgi:intracellular septation protein
MQWISLGVIAVFGGLTLLLHDDRFIRWKPTVLYWAFAATLLVGRVFFNASWLQKVMPKDELVLPEAVWIRLTWAWILFFAAMGCLNLYVAFNYSLDTWVNFKVFWSMGIILAFSLAQGVYMARHLPSEDQAAAPPPTP